MKQDRPKQNRSRRPETKRAALWLPYIYTLSSSSSRKPDRRRIPPQPSSLPGDSRFAPSLIVVVNRLDRGCIVLICLANLYYLLLRFIHRGCRIALQPAAPPCRRPALKTAYLLISSKTVGMVFRDRKEKDFGLLSFRAGTYIVVLSTILSTPPFYILCCYTALKLIVISFFTFFFVMQS